MNKKLIRWILKRLKNKSDNDFDDDTIDVHNKVYDKSTLKDQLDIIETVLDHNCMLDKSCTDRYTRTIRKVEELLDNINKLYNVNVYLPSEKLGCLCLEYDKGIYEYTLCTYLPDNKWFYSLNKETNEWIRHDNVVQWVELPPVQKTIVSDTVRE